MAKSKIEVVIDTRRLKRDLEKEVGDKAEESLRSLKTKELTDIGEAVIDEMKTAIAKGISPIKGKRRFPAYKWAEKKGQERRKKSLKKKALNKKYSNKYPYSVQDEYPAKKERPVNLELSGDFLNNLIAKVTNKQLRVGFFSKPWTKYEEGHREGAHGQPSRPIIPDADEQFSESVYRRLVKALQQIFNKKN